MERNGPIPPALERIRSRPRLFRTALASPVHNRACLQGGEVAMEFLPFARPTIDEAMIAAVADTLPTRSIVTGPRGATFEKGLSDRFARRAGRTLTSATAAMQAALELLEIRPG